MKNTSKQNRPSSKNKHNRGKKCLLLDELRLKDQYCLLKPPTLQDKGILRLKHDSSQKDLSLWKRERKIRH